MTPAELAKLFEQKAKEAVIKTLNEATILVQDTAKQMCPVDNGALRASIQTYVDEDSLTGWVFTESKYAPMVEYSTSPHIIRPKNAKALRFEVGRKERLGQQNTTGKNIKPNIVFAKEVHHPGTTEQPFLRPALDINKDNIKALFVANMKEAVKVLKK